MNRIHQLLFVISLFLVASNNNVVQSLEDASSSSKDVVTSSTTTTTTTTTATTKQPSSNLRSLWNTWTSTTSSSTSSSVRSSTNQQEQQPVEEELPKCQLCHDGSYPKRPNHGVVVSFYAFSFTGTCGNLYYELLNRPVLQTDAICNPMQDYYDWICGCNPNYVPPETPSDKVDLGTGYGSWGGW